MRTYIVGLLVMLSFTGCNKGVSSFQVNNIHKSKKYNRFFLKDEIKPLRNQWRELYSYLEKGHLLQHINNEGRIWYSYSLDLYSYLNRNVTKIYSTPFLKNFDQFILVFGEPNQIQKRNNKISFYYDPHVIGDCETCHYQGYYYVFDETTKKILKE
jgi:hypothetical protein